MKKLTALVVSVVMMLSMTTVFADFDALYTTSKVVVNGEEVAFEAYNINDNNYFKLRDVAKAISGTEKQFEVTWNQEANAIELISGTSYTEVGGELVQGDGTAKKASLTTSQIKLDGEWIASESLTAYNINDNNYFKLRDLGKLFDFGISWDGEANCITVDTQESYVDDTVKEFSLGTVDGNVYENEFIGIGCELSDGWTFSSEEEIKQANNVALDLMGEEYAQAINNADTAYAAMASDETGLGNFNIVLEKIDNELLAMYSEKEFLESQAPTAVEMLESMGMTNCSYEVTTLGELDVLNIYSEYSGVGVYQSQGMIKCDGYLAYITATAFDSETTQQILNNFYWLN